MKRYLFILITITLPFQCKKKEDQQVKDVVAPKVEITEPANSSQHSFQSDITLRGSATDNIALKAVLVTVKDLQGEIQFTYSITEDEFNRLKTAHHGPHNNVDATSFLLDSVFHPKNPGDYLMSLEAWDKENNSSSASVNFNVQ